MVTQASPAKLSDGTWGARVSGTVCVGTTIEIVTRKGRSWLASVYEVVSRRGGICVVRTAPAGAMTKKKTSKKRASRVETCGYPCPVSGRRCVAADPCHDCL